MVLIMENQPGLNITSVDIVGGIEHAVTYGLNNYTDAYPWIAKIIATLITISIPISVLMLIGVIYASERLKAIRRKEDLIFNTKVVPAYTEETSEADKELSERWRLVLQHIDSENPNDWKQAILDADVMLESMLSGLGYHGDTLGEKLTRAEKGDFKTISQAWEAHKVRNQIAHEGSAFALDKREARRIVMLFKEVFEEFYYI